MEMTARTLAYKILKSAEGNSTYSNIAIDKALKKNELSASESGLLTALVMGVTERRITLDYIIDKLADKPEGVDGDTRALLRIGIYQILYLDKIPEYAAVNETVNMAPRRSRGFVNAILRSLLRAIKGQGINALFPDKADKKYLTVKHSFPIGVCEVFTEIYGIERTEKIFEIFNRAPRLTLRINTLKISRDEYCELLAQSDISFEKSERVNVSVLVDGAAFGQLPGFDEGYFFIQDEASQMCVEALDAQCGDLVIDVCSCPGSKSLGSAIKMKNQGEIKSFDLHASKLSLIEVSAKRLGIDIIEAQERDGRAPDKALFKKADRVLCDVPCSGLGVIAKKPEIRYKDIGEFSRLPEIQYSILENSAKYVKAGGILVYSTCTVLPRENQENIDRFLKEHIEFEPVDFCVGNKKSVNGMLSLSPDEDRTDGFFIAKLKRKEA